MATYSQFTDTIQPATPSHTSPVSLPQSPSAISLTQSPSAISVTQSPSAISLTQIDPQTEPPPLDWLIQSNTDQSADIPKYHPIHVGTLVAVNYAGYHLPPWCYFRNKWSDLGIQDLDKGRDKVEEVTIKGMGEDDNMFLSRAHEFLGREGADGYSYQRYTPAHYVDTWTKFVSDDNEELLPPTMDEDTFQVIKDLFRELVDNHNNNENNNKLPTHLTDQLETLPEYKFEERLHEHAHLFPADKVEELLKQIYDYRTEQEEVLIKEIHRRIGHILGPDCTEFRSVLERRLEYDRAVDRCVRSLFVHRMRVQVRLNEVTDIRVYLRIGKDDSKHNVFAILESINGKITDVLTKEKTDEYKSKITEIEELCKSDEMKGLDGKLKPLENVFTDLKNELEPLYNFLKQLIKDKLDKTLTGYGSVNWRELITKLMTAEDKTKLQNELLPTLHNIDVMEIQRVEEHINAIKQKVEEDVKREVKLVAMQVQQRVDKLQKEEKQTDSNNSNNNINKPILSFKPTIYEHPFSVDDLNTYLRYPPIQNRLVYHEGNWPPLRAVESESTITVQRMKECDPQKEYPDVKLSNVIGRFDEAFTLFSSTLADHGMSRPVPLSRPVIFRYGMGEVVPAWDHSTKGISDMKLGEIRIMICPSRTCYGELGVPESVPPHMPLVYVVKMDGIYTKQDDNYESDDEES